MENQDLEPKVKKRPTFLTVLCIFSFISIGFGLLSVLIIFLGGKLSPEQMELMQVEYAKQVEVLQGAGAQDFSQLIEQLLRVQEYINENFYIHNCITLISLLLGLIGVRFMLQGFKRGFHMYIIYNIICVVIYYASVPASEVPSFLIITNVLFSALFVFLYSRNLHWMNK